MLRTLLFILLLSLVACQSKNIRAIEGQPIAYQDGYLPGCDSGYVAAGHPYYTFSKDVVRFSKDDLYQQGWTDGFNVCKGRYESYKY